MRFSQRTNWQPGFNNFAAALEQARAQAKAQGTELIDLTVSNPTQCGLGLAADDVLPPLSAPDALTYQPEPLGMTGAREAVVRYYRDHGAEVPQANTCLTTSTSEAYSFLFRLLCDPGDEVLIARPSYPLFELLAGLDDVVLREYPLFYEPGAGRPSAGRWTIDFATLEASITERTRAIILVHPNNPTGHYAGRQERAQLTTLCAERNLALIVDEVFLDYPIAAEEGSAETFCTEQRCLCFVLSGLSKICALPQMKASWIVSSGPADLVEEAMRRLEIVADTFLSMNAPVQHALGSWLALRHGVQERIRARLEANLLALDQRLQGSLAERLTVEAGWTAVLRVPRHVDGESFVWAALRQGVVVQPGEFYGLPEGRCVVSLLTVPEQWQQGLARLPV